jgi:Tfp pilus assembly protein PilX
LKTRLFDALRRHEGMALIAVIFLLLVIGALGIAISNVMQDLGSEVGLQLTANCDDYSAAAGARYRSQYIADSTFTSVSVQTNTMTSASTLPSNCSSFITFGSGVWPDLNVHSQVP